MYVSKPNPSSGVNKVTVGDVSTALVGMSGDFQVLRMDAYGSTLSAGTSFPESTFTLVQKNLLVNATGQDLQTLSVTDFGTASNAPGVSFRVPKGRSIWWTKDTSATAELLTSTTGCYVVVQVMQQLVVV